MSFINLHVFTTREKKVFMEILKSHASVFENKNTDSATLHDKNMAWDSVTRKYNASPHVTCKVSKKQLWRLWMNLRQQMKEAVTKQRPHRMDTGLQSSTSGAELDPNVAQIARALIVEIDEAIDSDANFNDSAENTSAGIENSQPDLTLQNPHLSTSSGIRLQAELSPMPSFPTTTDLTPPDETTPPFPSAKIPSPPQSMSSTSTYILQKKKKFFEKEYRDRFTRASEIHALEKELLKYKVREAKAKAELAELMLERERTQDTEQI